MGKKVSALILLFLCNLSLVWAQSSISGIITDEKGVGVPFANVYIEPTSSGIGTTTEFDGKYVLNKVPSGDIIIVVSCLGYEQQRHAISIKKNSKSSVNFQLKEKANKLDELEIVTKSERTEMEIQPITVTSLDLQSISDQSFGAEEVLKQSSGVVIRQNGGLGDNAQINLNGMTGNAVRTYYDGIPVESYGGALQLNTIPVDALKRMDVYKGVMPIDVGTDALGGGINLVPVDPTINYLRTSYTIGSFNTHRLTLSANKILNDKVSLSLLSYANYSDNDYVMRGIKNLNQEVLDDGTIVYDEEVVDAKRFHNAHGSSFVEAKLGLRDLKWADKLYISGFHSYRYDERQHGNSLQATAYGEITNKIQSYSGRVDYRKNLWNDKVHLRYYGIISEAKSTANDSTGNVYNWKGEILGAISNQSGAEAFPQPTNRRGINLSTVHRFMGSFEIVKNLTLGVSNFYRYSKIHGEDPFAPRLKLNGESIDLNTLPTNVQRNIFGVQLESKWIDERLTLVGFYKQYNFNAESIMLILTGFEEEIPRKNVKESRNGYGVGVKFQLHEKVFLRGSYENTTRIPTEREIFGDFGPTVPNYALKPESSKNFNLGISFDHEFSEIKYIRLKLDGFIRDQENLIRVDQYGVDNQVFINEGLVTGTGTEFSAKIKLLKGLAFNGSATYQSSIINTPQLDGSPVGAQVPNVPILYSNGGVSYKLDSLSKNVTGLRLFVNYFFTDRYSINEVADLETANPDFIIPRQHLMNCGFVVTPNVEGLNLSFTLRNVLDKVIYDNFRIPKPGINYSFKISYSL